MVFLPHPSAGQLGTVPDDIPISEFMLNEKHGRLAHDQSRDPFTCGLSGKSYSSRQVVDRVDHIARGLAKEFGWSPNNGTEWDKTIAVFSLNSVRGMHLLEVPVLAQNATNMYDDLIDRHAAILLGRSSTRRSCFTSKCSILGRRAQAPIGGLKGKGPVYMRSPPACCARRRRNGGLT